MQIPDYPVQRPSRHQWIREIDHPDQPKNRCYSNRRMQIKNDKKSIMNHEIQRPTRLHPPHINSLYHPRHRTRHKPPTRVQPRPAKPPPHQYNNHHQPQPYRKPEHRGHYRVRPHHQHPPAHIQLGPDHKDQHPPDQTSPDFFHAYFSSSTSDNCSVGGASTTLVRRPYSPRPVAVSLAAVILY